MSEPQGVHIIGGISVSSEKRFSSFNPAIREEITPKVSEGSSNDIDQAVRVAEEAGKIYGNLTLKKRSEFLKEIALSIESNKELIIRYATAETALPDARILMEIGRTCGQLRMFAGKILQGKHLDIRIDTALPDRTPMPRSDLRMGNRPLGVVGVFGASNFPLAFSTAGGDTASALAAGCSVVFKSHPLHPHTSEIVARAIVEAAKKIKIPEGVFNLVQGENFEIGHALVSHPKVKAVGFTGSLKGGQVLFNLAMNRKEPIPFYGELGSVNPVILLPNALQEKTQVLAENYIASVSMGAGQFCTGPGLCFLIKSSDQEKFLKTFEEKALQAPQQTMLADTIFLNYEKGIENLSASGQAIRKIGPQNRGKHSVSLDAFVIDGQTFRENTLFSEENFGPSVVFVVCRNFDELKNCLKTLEGQLTATLWMNDTDEKQAREVADILGEKVGRLLFNGFPTGVEVCDAMMHGGPYPASTNPKYTSVGSQAIMRFLRPVCYQNTPQKILPPELRNENFEGISRMVNGKLTQESV